jgi:hypothetical protein
LVKPRCGDQQRASVGRAATVFLSADDKTATINYRYTAIYFNWAIIVHATVPSAVYLMEEPI